MGSDSRLMTLETVAVLLARAVRAAEEWSEHHDRCEYCRFGESCRRGEAIKALMDARITETVAITDAVSKRKWEQLPALLPAPKVER